MVRRVEMGLGGDIVPDFVRKGETIALMGSSGRSTGAHVHYEVYKHGRSVDPSSYLARTRRR